MALHLQYRCKDRFFNQDWRVGKHRSDSRYSSCTCVTFGSDTCCCLYQLPSYCCITTLPHPGELLHVPRHDPDVLWLYMPTSNWNFLVFFFFFLATQELLAFLEVSEATTWLHRSGRRRSWERQHCCSRAMLKRWQETWINKMFLLYTDFYKH